MIKEISVMPTYSQNGETINLIIQSPEGYFISNQDLLETLESYIEVLREKDPDTQN